VGGERGKRRKGKERRGERGGDNRRIKEGEEEGGEGKGVEAKRGGGRGRDKKWEIERRKGAADRSLGHVSSINSGDLGH